MPSVPLSSIPISPGVYTWFDSGEPVYAGKASGTGGPRDRLGKHLSLGNDLSRSSFRRNVAERLLDIPTSVSRQRPSVVTTEQAEKVNAWIGTLELAWVEFPTPPEAIAFEPLLLSEWTPPLSKAIERGGSTRISPLRPARPVKAQGHSSGG